ncbi:MAG: hypothetical protein KDA92_08180, partial [Planctomycetales bacterium]|nr:hypothetical protein [Planctomycetales bacterium]
WLMRRVATSEKRNRKRVHAVATRRNLHLWPRLPAINRRPTVMLSLRDELSGTPAPSKPERA